MKYILTILLCSILQLSATAQTIDSSKPYSPTANAKLDINEAVELANKTDKHVILMTGGNWCSWCLRFNTFIRQDAQLDSAVKANFVFYHLNYSKENKNHDILAKYGYPQRFGFPVFIILDENGNRIHTQNSAYLEEGKGYSKAKVLEFFDHWSPKALKPESYKD
ncbi:MAG: thioredoxin family protein [Chitinophagaceae bacterium]